jgi:HPt (histidine-containing phosphotransfer) domain-containing protein
MSDDPMEARLAMLRRVGGDRLIRDLIDLLFERAPRQIEAVRQALAAGDAEAARRAAHALTSSAGNLGARDLQAAALAVEQAAAGETGEDAAELLRRLEAAWEATRPVLAERKGGLSP